MTNLDKNSTVVLRSHDRQASYPLIEIANRLCVPVNRFAWTELKTGGDEVLYNPYTEKLGYDMYWIMHQDLADTPVVAWEIAHTLNTCLMTDDAACLEEHLRFWMENFQQYSFEEQELVLAAFDSYTAMRKPKEPFIEDGIFIWEEKQFRWPVHMIREAGFEFWWQHAIEDRYAGHSLNKSDIYALTCT